MVPSWKYSFCRPLWHQKGPARMQPPTLGFLRLHLGSFGTISQTTFLHPDQDTSTPCPSLGEALSCFSCYQWEKILEESPVFPTHPVGPSIVTDPSSVLSPLLSRVTVLNQAGIISQLDYCTNCLKGSMPPGLPTPRASSTEEQSVVLEPAALTLLGHVIAM